MPESPPTRNTIGALSALLSATIASAGVHFTCPSSKFAVGNQIVGELSKTMRSGRVQSASIPDRGPSIITATCRGNRGLQNLDVELGALRNGKFASIDIIIITLDHLHTGVARPWRVLPPVSDNPHRPAVSHRIVGYGDCQRLIRRAYAFGMVMYWVCAGWVSVGYALMVNSKFTRAVCTWLMSPVMRNVASAITLRRLRPPFSISSMTMT